MVDAWDYPVFIIAMFVAAIAVSVWIIRLASPRRPAAFECKVCGRRERGASARAWRYCPYCGAPRSSTRLGQMPHQRRSVVDL